MTATPQSRAPPARSHSSPAPRWIRAVERERFLFSRSNAYSTLVLQYRSDIILHTQIELLFSIELKIALKKKLKTAILWYKNCRYKYGFSFRGRYNGQRYSIDAWNLTSQTGFLPHRKRRGDDWKTGRRLEWKQTDRPDRTAPEFIYPG